MWALWPVRVFMHLQDFFCLYLHGGGKEGGVVVLELCKCTQLCEKARQEAARHNIVR